MTYKILSILLLCCCCVAWPVEATGITNFSRLITADYWTENNPRGEELILDAQGVADLNKKIRASSSSVYDLTAYPTTISGAELRQQLSHYELLEDEICLNGNKVSNNYKEILKKQTNLKAVPATVAVRYGVTIRRSDLRGLPTGERLFYYANDKEFDLLQETSLDPCEPLIVLHQSDNGYFYYVQSRNYSGWLSKFDMALTDRTTWLEYAQPKDFLVVTGKNIKLKTWGEFVEYQQGSILPVSEQLGSTYVFYAPMRNDDGSLAKVKTIIRKNNILLHEGYLPYTSNNIITAAFKFYGMPYGWGGLKSSVDCSSLLYNAYRTVGIYLPRDADQQAATAGVKHNFDGLTSEQRLEAIRGLRPGAGLFKENHCFIYLGTSNDVPFAIHALGSYYQDGNNVPVMRVIVSDLSLQSASGATMLDSLWNGVEYK